MLTLIKLINTLNQQLDKLKTNRGIQIIRLQTVCAIIALSTVGLVSIEAAAAKSANKQSIRQNLQQLANRNQPQPKRLAWPLAG